MSDKLSERMRSWDTMEFYNVRRIADAWADEVAALEVELADHKRVGAELLDERDEIIEDVQADNAALRKRIENLEETNMLFSERGASLVVEKKALEQRVKKAEEIVRIFMWATGGKFDEQETGDIGDMIEDAREKWRSYEEVHPQGRLT